MDTSSSTSSYLSSQLFIKISIYTVGAPDGKGSGYDGRAPRDGGPHAGVGVNAGRHFEQSETDSCKYLSSITACVS